MKQKGLRVNDLLPIEAILFFTKKKVIYYPLFCSMYCILRLILSSLTLD
jgi:hypothetical protein